ncbi:MAG: Cdc6-like AAA superfamily ATPase [Bradymonadia bacterium]|jgi:Cdc6-like AAA superfamily ATPase
MSEIPDFRFLDHFDPVDVSPALLVNRTKRLAWLTGKFSHYFNLPDTLDRGESVCVSGKKGIGKSILSRSVIQGLRATHSGQVIFVHVDCRACPKGWRQVFQHLCEQVVRELDDMSRSHDVPQPLMATAGLLWELSKYDEVSLKKVHEQVSRFSTALKLGGRRSLLSALRLNLNIDIGMDDKKAKALTGVVNFDQLSLCQSLVALFKDIRECGLNALVYLDNIDELRHDYRDEDTLAQVMTDVKQVLELKRAPIGLLLNMRDYFTGILPRDISNFRNLRAMETEELVKILTLRLDRESLDTKALINAHANDAIDSLVRVAVTPLALLRWFRFLYEDEEAWSLSPETLEAGLVRYVESVYAGVRVDHIRQVARVFDTPTGMASADEIKAACGEKHAVFDQLLERQVILPVDFWHPVYFTLDPELHFLHPSHGIFE